MTEKITNYEEVKKYWYTIDSRFTFRTLWFKILKLVRRK